MSGDGRTPKFVLRCSARESLKDAVRHSAPATPEPMSLQCAKLRLDPKPMTSTPDPKP